MNSRSWLLSVSLAVALLPGFVAGAPQGIDLGAVSRLPMLDNGRVKPFDTYARETVRFITGSEVFQKRDPVELILDIAFDFKKWTDVPLVSIDFLPLKEKLGVKREVKFLGAAEIVSNSKYQALMEEIRKTGKDPDKLPRLEKEVVLLYHRVSVLENQMEGQGWKVIPNEKDANGAWLTLSDTSDEAVKKAFAAMTTAYSGNDASGFNRAVGELAARVKTSAKPELVDATRIEREVWYHRFRPFEKSSVLYLLAFLAFLVSSTLPPRRMYKVAVFLALAGFAMHVYGMALRSLISGRAPVSNVYETMLFVPFGINLFALTFELVHRARYFGLTATFLGAAILTLSDFVSLDPYVSPLVPVLRSNYWLIIHVLTITLGYAAATLCLGLGHLWLGVFVWNKGSAPSLKSIEKYLYQAIQVTVFFIGTGTILGGVWAN
ncbi:MAG: cytochrome c biogenesis protein CcsA, partial [Candidatus Wallbacteria bacterium]|nr:cytochrome c biogenesis protein CcsA [Candidatus Wallbacteria bacterium]